MGAYLNHAFSKGFILTEEALVRITDIILKRVPQLPAKEIVLRVFRSDGLIVEYSSTGDFVSDNNLKNGSLSEVVVAVNHKELRLALSFSRERGAEIKMETKERDSAFLLSSDLKEYLSSEVLKHWKPPTTKNLGPILFGAGFLLPMFLILAISTSRFSGDFDRIVKSGTVQDKLNFLVLNSPAANPIYNYLLVVIPILFIGFMYALIKLQKYFFPVNVFLFSREAESFNRLQSLRDKVLWGIIIAIVISVGTAIFTGWLGLR